MADPGCAGGGGSVLRVPPPLTFEKLERWTAEAEAGLGDALYRDRDEIASGVDSGALELYRIDGGRSWLVTRVYGSDIIVCCYQGDRLREVCRVIAKRAAELGLTGARFYTARPGLARLLAEFGFTEQLRMYRARINPDEWL